MVIYHLRVQVGYLVGSQVLKSYRCFWEDTIVTRTQLHQGFDQGTSQVVPQIQLKSNCLGAPSVHFHFIIFYSSKMARTTH